MLIEYVGEDGNKIKNIEIATNGSIVPPKETLEVLRKER